MSAEKREGNSAMAQKKEEDQQDKTKARPGRNGMRRCDVKIGALVDIVLKRTSRPGF